MSDLFLQNMNDYSPLRVFGCLIIFLIDCGFSNRLKSVNNIFKKNAFKTKETFEIKNVRDLFACGDNVCTIIEEFNISQNNRYSCHEQTLGIDFKVDDTSSPKKSVTAYGYLSMGFRTRILDKKKITKSCPRFKK